MTEILQNRLRLLIFAGIVILISSCASVIEPNAGIFDCDSHCEVPSVSNGFFGKFVLRWDAKNDLSIANKIAQKYCTGSNGVKSGPNVYVQYPNWVTYQFQCNGFSVPTNNSVANTQPISSKNIPEKSKSNSLNLSEIDEIKSKCADLGFKEGTEGFGKCVLKLTK